MKKVIFSLLTLALVTSISSSALATEKNEATEVNTLAGIFYDREPNDTKEQANPYMIGGQINGEITWDKDIEDWYTFTPTKSGKISIMFAYSKEKKNIFDMKVYKKATTIGLTENPGEALLLDVEAGTKYYIRIASVIISDEARHDYNVYSEYIN
ncbi:hypothetical protein [Brevibacillus daliensis]|uniref:hypothetical protein n=1 Tax=Brevibacillus daliensis TaxID=2892995 RepID=UPI001E638086|nr:hypothetical protein [Brevibacillus daliensis]